MPVDIPVTDKPVFDLADALFDSVGEGGYEKSSEKEHPEQGDYRSKKSCRGVLFYIEIAGVQKIVQHTEQPAAGLAAVVLGQLKPVE